MCFLQIINECFRRRKLPFSVSFRAETSKWKAFFLFLFSWFRKLVIDHWKRICRIIWHCFQITIYNLVKQEKFYFCFFSEYVQLSCQAEGWKAGLNESRWKLTLSFEFVSAMQCKHKSLSRYVRQRSPSLFATRKKTTKFRKHVQAEKLKRKKLNKT